jgi:hypothetical protein
MRFTDRCFTGTSNGAEKSCEPAHEREELRERTEVARVAAREMLDAAAERPLGRRPRPFELDDERALG